MPGVRCLDANQDLGAVYQTDDFQIKFHLISEDKRETFDVNPLHAHLWTGSLPQSRIGANRSGLPTP